jgi:hypothetical protein
MSCRHGGRAGPRRASGRAGCAAQQAAWPCFTWAKCRSARPPPPPIPTLHSRPRPSLPHQESYLLLSAPGFAWLPPPPPARLEALSWAAAAAAAALAAGALGRAPSLLLLVACCGLAAADPDPGSQATSLLLQLGAANCLLPLAGCWTLGGALAWRRRRRGGGPEAGARGAAPGAAAPAAAPRWSVLLLRALLVKPYWQVRLRRGQALPGVAR